MNEEDKQAFEDWLSDASNHCSDALAYEHERNFCYQAWMAGCEYMRNKCNPLDALSLYEKLELERAKNKKLRDALDFYAKQSNWMGYHREVDTIIRSDCEPAKAFEDGFDIFLGGKRAREALKEVDNA